MALVPLHYQSLTHSLTRTRKHLRDMATRYMLNMPRISKKTRIFLFFSFFPHSSDNSHMALPLVIAFAVFLFFAGACVGSFLNVVIWRLPNYGREVLFQDKRGPLTLNWPPSHCPVCDVAIKWYHNIPIFAWIFLHAKCANCKTHIPVRYPFVELALGVAFAGYFLATFVGQWSPPPLLPLLLRI